MFVRRHLQTDLLGILADRFGPQRLLLFREFFRKLGVDVIKNVVDAGLRRVQCVLHDLLRDHFGALLDFLLLLIVPQAF